MNKNTIKYRTNPEENIVNNPLDEIIRNGAKKMLHMALDIEVNLFLERYQYILDEKGNRQIINNLPTDHKFFADPGDFYE